MVVSNECLSKRNSDKKIFLVLGKEFVSLKSLKDNIGFLKCVEITSEELEIIRHYLDSCRIQSHNFDERKQLEALLKKLEGL